MTGADVLARVAELRRTRTPFVLATVVRALRPTSATPGDRALVLPDGTLEGFVGGACVRSTVRLQALRLLAGGRATLLHVVPDDPRGDGAAPRVAGGDRPGGHATPTPRGVGAAVEPVDAAGVVTVRNPCLSGGALDIFLEVVRPPVLVHVVGDTPVAHALTAVGVAMGWEMRRHDDPGAPVPADADAVVVASQGGDERQALAAGLRAGVPYVGLIASRRRGVAVVDGLPPDQRETGRLHTPAGHDIGARTPGEVAVSILAEIIACRTERGPTGESAAASTGGQAAPAEVTDPVCGMTVTTTTDGPRLTVAGTVFHFCGPGCRDAFATDPRRYTDRV